MQPKQNIWNLVLFVVLSTFVLFGWNRLQIWLWPPQPRPPQPVVKMRLPDSRLWADLPALASGSTLTSATQGVGSYSQLAVDMAVAQWAAGGPPKAELARKPENEPQPSKELPKVAPLAAAPPEKVTLGGAGFNLRVDLTSKGAGVQSIVLTQFKAANTMGRPEDSELLLVPGKDGPSNILKDYARPNDEEPRDTLGEQPWSVQSRHIERGQDKHEVTFEMEVPEQHVRIFKTYTLNRNDYHIGLAVKIKHEGGEANPLKFRYRITGSHGLPLEDIWCTNTYCNAMIGYEDEAHHFWRDFQDSRSIPQPGGRPVPFERKDDIRIRYAGVAVQYFASVIAVDDEQDKQDFVKQAQPIVMHVRDIVKDPVTEVDELKATYTPTAKRPYRRYKKDKDGKETNEPIPDTQKPFLNDITVHIDSECELRPGQEVVHKYLLYNGPVKVQLLGDGGAGGNAVPPGLLDRYLNNLHLNTLTDYQSPWWFGSIAHTIGWSYLLIKVTNFMHGILGWLHTIIPNYGVCIILLTVLVRGLMHPVSRKQARTSIKMQALVPELKKLQEKYKNDRQAMAMAQMELYRKHGVSPMGSCWVVLLQMPIFMGLYYALQESIHFRLARFLWIENLAAPDMLFYWGQSIPWINRLEDMGWFLYLGPYFNLLPIFAVALMIVQQKFLMPPATDETQEMQQKMMKYMSIFFGIMFYKVAAGLCIYFIVSSVWGLTERKLLPKAKPVTAPAAPAAGPGGTSGKAVAVRPKPRGSKGGQTNGTLKKVQDMWTELLKQAKKK